MTNMHHELKIWPVYFEAKLKGIKPWEWRDTHDRTFSEGDLVTFREYDHLREEYTGRFMGPVTITYIAHKYEGHYDIFTHSMPQGLMIEDLVDATTEEHRLREVGAPPTWALVDFWQSRVSLT
jgi:hypothetical protein